MNTMKAVLPCAALLALASCVRTRSILDNDAGAPDSAGPITQRSDIDLAELTPDQRAALVARQARDSVMLDAVGFLRREASLTGGYFVDPDEIAAIEPRTMTDIFKHVPVLIERPDAPGIRVRGDQACFITYVNGIVRQARLLSDLETFFPVRTVLAAEVYPPGDLPPAPFSRPSSRASCTTVALWTRP